MHFKYPPCGEFLCGAIELVSVLINNKAALGIKSNFFQQPGSFKRNVLLGNHCFVFSN